MPSCHRRSPAGWSKRDARRRRCARSGFREADDGAIWRHAEARGGVIVTKDEDFALRVQATETGPCAVWLRMGNTSNAALRAWFVPRVPQIVALLAQGTRLVEIR